VGQGQTGVVTIACNRLQELSLLTANDIGVRVETGASGVSWLRPVRSQVLRNSVLVFGCVVAICLVASPPTFADQINLTVNNNCGGSCSPPVPQGTLIAVVSLTPDGSNVDITLTAQAGFSLKIEDGNDVNFMGPAGLTQASIKNFTVDGKLIGSDFKLGTGGNADGFGSFSYNIEHICDPQTCSATSATKITFTITGVTVAQLEKANGNGYEWAVHFCDGGGTNCAPSTGFAVNGTQQVPEPPVKVLLACSALLLGGFLRRPLLRRPF
jgi:hypothetical protein